MDDTMEVVIDGKVQRRQIAAFNREDARLEPVLLEGEEVFYTHTSPPVIVQGRNGYE